MSGSGWVGMWVGWAGGGEGDGLDERRRGGEGRSRDGSFEGAARVRQR